MLGVVVYGIEFVSPLLFVCLFVVIIDRLTFAFDFA